MKIYLPTDSGRPMTQEHTRPVYVPDSLDALKGSSERIVILPIELDWTPYNTYDLSRPQERTRLYQTVLSEAGSEEDVCRYIDRSGLEKGWVDLRLPKRVRYAWESVFPRLGRIHVSNN